MKNEQLEKDLFDLTFWFIGVFAIFGFIISIPLFYLFRFLHELLATSDALLFYSLYSLEMLLLAILTGKIGMDYYLKQLSIKANQKALLLRNVAIFFAILVFFQILGPWLNLVINLLVLAILYGYVAYRIKKA